jgi:mannose-6-phosphate isomerase-like protein (cupin superfamily)
VIAPWSGRGEPTGGDARVVGPALEVTPGLAAATDVAVGAAVEPGLGGPDGNVGWQAATSRTTASANAGGATPAGIRADRRVIAGLYPPAARAAAPVLGCRAVDAFELDDLLAARAAAGRLYHEFIRTHDLSVGLYVLPAGGTDPQGPHTEDEVYHVVSGRARIRVGGQDRPVAAGSTVFVGADVEHRFHDIEEELVVLVMFGPAEYTHRADHQGGRPHGAAPG